MTDFAASAASCQEPDHSDSPHEPGRRLVLIRHGRYADPETAGYRFIGRSDPALDQIGREQARALRSEMTMFDRPLVITSPLARAHQTAEIVFPGVQLVIDPLAMEIDFGKMEGMDFVEALAKYPAAMRRYPELDFTAVNGENRRGLVARAAALFEKCRKAEGDQPIVIVSHAYFLDAFCAVADNEPKRPYSRAFQHCVPVKMRIRN